ncbi:MAG: hypothetical protein IJ800_04150 [Clostridia bacterium]|nr:hypothetical protein [Clostridia bacterium]
MRKIKLILITVLSAMFVCSLAACGTEGSQGPTTYLKGEISGVSELRIKAGEGTDARLLRDVIVKLSDGSKVKPELKKGDFNADKSGKYEISYTYGNLKANANVFVYETPKIYFGDKEISSDSIEVSYREARDSYDFVKGIKVIDGLGDPLDFSLTEGSEEFTGRTGNYKVGYVAEDPAGNRLEKKVTFVVGEGRSPVVTSGTYVVKADGVTVPCDLKGETDGILYMNGEAVYPTDYNFNATSLKLGAEFALTLSGSYDFVIETAEGKGEFTLNIEDEGYPVFAMENFAAQYTYGAAKSALPVDKRENSSGYTYAYALSEKNGTKGKAIVNADGLNFLGDDGKQVKVGSYDLTITATAGNGKSSSLNYSFTVNYPVISGGERSSVKKVALDESVYGVTEAYLWEKPDDSPAWEGRAYMSAPAYAYAYVSYDVMFTYCQNAADGKANAVFRGVAQQDYNRLISCVDKQTGESISVDDILIGKWYTVLFNSTTTTDTALYFYVNPYGGAAVGATAYIANLNIILTDDDITGIALSKLSGSTATLTPSTEFTDTGAKVTLAYTSSSAWYGRIGFTDRMFNLYNSYYNNKKAEYLSFDMQFAGAASALYMWNMNESNGYAQTSLGALLENGTATAVDSNGVKATALEADKWYTVKISLEKFGILRTRNANGAPEERGIQFGSETTVLFKNIQFV